MKELREDRQTRTSVESTCGSRAWPVVGIFSKGEARTMPDSLHPSGKGRNAARFSRRGRPRHHQEERRADSAGRAGWRQAPVGIAAVQDRTCTSAAASCAIEDTLAVRSRILWRNHGNRYHGRRGTVCADSPDDRGISPGEATPPEATGDQMVAEDGGRSTAPAVRSPAGARPLSERSAPIRHSRF